MASFLAEYIYTDLITEHITEKLGDFLFLDTRVSDTSVLPKNDLQPKAAICFKDS